MVDLKPGDSLMGCVHCDWVGATASHDCEGGPARPSARLGTVEAVNPDGSIVVRATLARSIGRMWKGSGSLNE